MNAAIELLKSNGKPIPIRKFEDIVSKLRPDSSTEWVCEKLNKAIQDAKEVRITHIKFNPTPGGKFHKAIRTIANTHFSEQITLGELEELGIELTESDLSGSSNNFFAEVSRRILALIKDGNMPWRMPWNEHFRDSSEESILFGNYITNKNYRGINREMCMLFGQGDKYYLTKAQAEERGGKIVDPKQFVPIGYFIKTVTTETVSRKNDKGETEVVDLQKVIAGMKWYKVYGISNIQNLKPIKRKNVTKSKGLDFTPIEAAEKIVAGYRNRPEIHHKGNQAFYSPGSDSVTMPPKKAFIGVPQYYSTLFHELLHSTGHPKRLNRIKGKKFGDKAYAQEELIAELGSSFLCSICKLDYYTLNNSAAYLKSWSNKLVHEISNDKQFFLKTQFAALKAAKYMMGGFYQEWQRSLEPVKIGSKRKKNVPKKSGIKSSQKAITSDIDDLPDWARSSKSATKKPKKKVKQTAAEKFYAVTEKDFLAEYLLNKRIKTSSWDQFADKNLRDKTIALHWLSTSNGMPLDKLAHHYLMERGFTGIPDEQEIIQEIIDFVLDNPTGVRTYMRKRQAEDDAENPLLNGTKKGLGDSVNTSAPKRHLSARELSAAKIETLKLPNVWAKWLGSPAPNFDMVVYGGPGARKTTLLLLLADDLGKMGKRVAFASSEEFGSPTLASKVKYLEIEDVDFAGHYRDFDLSKYDVLFLDSVNDMRLTLEDYKKLRAEQPHLAVIFILQSTKSGSFRGGQDWIHEAEIQVEVQNGKTITHKNRWNSQVTEIDLNQ